LPKNKLHIVAFDVPYPADYGGVIDIYYKCKELNKLGVSIALHIYQYGRKKNDEKLKEVCDHLYYYKRHTFKNPFVGSKPYIVATRNGEELLENLRKDNAPILFEGLHCTYHIDAVSLKNRFKTVRTHNIEHHYYKHLERSELSYFKKYFFRIEAEKLRKYESKLKHASLIAAISPNDTAYFSKKYDNVIYLPAFHSNEDLKYSGKKGKYLLYHGNLSVPENYMAAIELVNNIFNELNSPVIIAGNNPPKQLIDLCEKYEHIQLSTDLQTKDLNELIKNAHINVLYTNQNTGIKLKLLNALYRGKFSVVNPLMVKGSGLEEYCLVGEDFKAMLQHIRNYLLLDFTKAYAEKRASYLSDNFGNSNGAQLLIDQIDFTGVDKPVRQSDKGILKRLSQLSSVMSYFSL